MSETFAELVAKIPQPPIERDFTEVYFESTLEECYAHNRGYNRAIEGIRRYLSANGKDTAWTTNMLNDLKNHENSSFATDVIGG